MNRCIECNRSYSGKTNPKVNAVSRIAEQLVGGSKALYALSKADRLAIRAHATRLHESGAAVARVALAEEDKTPDGFVYVLVNPAWPECVKIGSAVDVQSRLDQFQTGSPHRDYVMVYSVYTHDRMKAERACHAQLAHARLEGEWFSCSVEWAKAVLNQVRDDFDEADVRLSFARVEA
jgi:hypothetical protein